MRLECYFNNSMSYDQLQRILSSRTPAVLKDPLTTASKMKSIFSTTPPTLLYKIQRLASDSELLKIYQMVLIRTIALAPPW